MAWVFMLATSEPVFGSVVTKKPSSVPATQPGTYFRFGASVPNLHMASAGPRFCMLKGSRHDADTLAICSAISTDSMNPMPLPPYSSGSAQEKKPSAPIFATRSALNSCLRSSSSSVGAICSAANRRAVSWISRCSSRSSKFIAGCLSPRSSSLEHDQNVVLGHLVPFLDPHFADRAGSWREDRVLHLQRLDDHQLVVFLDLASRLDEHRPDVAGQRGADLFGPRVPLSQLVALA